MGMIHFQIRNVTTMLTHFKFQVWNNDYLDLISAPRCLLALNTITAAAVETYIEWIFPALDFKLKFTSRKEILNSNIPFKLLSL